MKSKWLILPIESKRMPNRCNSEFQFTIRGVPNNSAQAWKCPTQQCVRESCTDDKITIERPVHLHKMTVPLSIFQFYHLNIIKNTGNYKRNCNPYLAPVCLQALQFPKIQESFSWNGENGCWMPLTYTKILMDHESKIKKMAQLVSNWFEKESRWLLTKLS